MKAKDLIDKNIDEESQQDDQVAAAYENISKRLESIRNGKSEESDDTEESKGSKDTDEVELEEWKGPKPPAKDIELEEAEIDIRKVKLHNLEDGEDKKSDEPEESEEGEEVPQVPGVPQAEEEEEASPKKDWEPKQNDPLDEEEDGAEPKESEGSNESKVNDNKEDGEDVDDSDESKESEESKDEEEEDLHSEIRKPEVSEAADLPEDVDRSSTSGPDTLDDLTDENLEMPQRREMPEKDEEEFAIPNLKGSGQRGGDLSYNTHPEREGIGQSYSAKTNYMEGNDPNNFFSQHQQPQAPKRANKFHLLVLVLIGIAVIGFTVYILKGGFGDINLGTATPSPSPSATATPEPTPTPTPEPIVERGNFTVKVLNGTTTSGLAGKIRDKLKELGYKTVTPGNNSDTDMAQTEIRVKEGSQSAELLQRLTLDLSPDYEAKEGGKLDKKTAYDAEVIIGAK